MRKFLSFSILCMITFAAGIAQSQSAPICGKVAALYQENHRDGHPDGVRGILSGTVYNSSGDALFTLNTESESSIAQTAYNTNSFVCQCSNRFVTYQIARTLEEAAKIGCR